MKTTLTVATATSRTLKVALKFFFAQFESPSTRDYRRLKDFLSNG